MLQAIGKPFGWLLLKLYELTGNYGIALILFAVVIRLILMPFTVKSRLGVMKTQLIAPQMKELEKRHGSNSPKYAEEVRKLYKEEGIKPLSSCLWAFIQFPILLALYQGLPALRSSGRRERHVHQKGGGSGGLPLPCFQI